MGVEVERKFLVSGDSLADAVTSATRIVQGYIAQTELRHGARPGAGRHGLPDDQGGHDRGGPK